jgi:hypothetical protein
LIRRQSVLDIASNQRPLALFETMRITDGRCHRVARNFFSHRRPFRMSGARGQQRPSTAGRADNAEIAENFDYLPPCSLLLEGLGVTEADLTGSGTVPVSRKFLRVLISELACRPRVDEHWYAETYPDVEGARLAGDIKSLREHFIVSGYIEGRLPAPLPFDPRFYCKHYRDIADAFPSADADTLRRHFLSSGYFEGRAGTAEMLAGVERWQALTKA